MKSNSRLDIAASRYGRRWAIGVFIVWLALFVCFIGQRYGWSTPASRHDNLRSGLILLVGAVVSFAVGKRAESRHKRSTSSLTI